MIETVEASLGDTQLCVVGFGSDAQIDGPLLARIASDHGGQFTRALDGLLLQKFFGVCFEDGALADPEHILHEGDEFSDPHIINVCGEKQITIIIGWGSTATPLRIHIRPPKGKNVGGKYIKETRGRTWLFVRIPLPHNRKRDGHWTFTVDRVPTGGEFPPPPTDVKYFFLVVCAGGPKLRYLGSQQRLYTGDAINPMVSLQYPNRTVPHGAKIQLHVVASTRALGALVQKSGLKTPRIDSDAISAFRSTLQEIERKHDRLPIAPDTMTISLHDDGMHDDGAMDPDGVFNNPLSEFAVVEGTYDYRAVVQYGDGCAASREAFWSVHVEPGIDPDASDSSIVDVTDVDGTNRGTFVVIPRDRYGNPLGPGRSDIFDVYPVADVVLTGEVKDRSDGSYSIGIKWGADVDKPSIMLQQPDRPPGLFVPPAPKGPSECAEPECSGKAEALLDCMGLPESEVKKIRIKSVCFEVTMKEDDC